MDYNDIDDIELITLLEENDENVRKIGRASCRERV